MPVKFEEETPGQIAFGISKKKAKRAVDRNRIKRLLREVYRKQKHRIYECNDQQYAMILICLNADDVSYDRFEQCFESIVKKFIRKEGK